MNSQTGAPQAALIIGAGDATGGAIAKRFAREGMVACVTRRDAEKLQAAGRRHHRARRTGARIRVRRRAGGRKWRAGRADTSAISPDRSDGVQHRRERAVQHPGRNVPANYFKIWGNGLLADFWPDRKWQRMAARGHGTILFTGATAGMRGSAIRRVRRAPSLRCARWRKAWHENWGEDIHGRARCRRRRDRHRIHSREFSGALCDKDQDGILNPEHMPDNYWHLHAHHATPGRTELDCGHGWKSGDAAIYHKESDNSNKGNLMNKKMESILISAARLRTCLDSASRRSRARRG